MNYKDHEEKIENGVMSSSEALNELMEVAAKGLSPFNPISTGLFGCCSTGGVFYPLLNSFFFKNRLLKLCTELLWDKMNVLR